MVAVDGITLAQAIATPEIRGMDAAEKVSFKYYSAALGAVFRAVETTSIGAREYGVVGKPQVLTFVPEVSMVAYVNVTGDLANYASAGDKVAAFVDGVCCGVGELLDGDVYKIVMKGYEGQAGKVVFKYYNAQCSYLFATDECIEFEDATEVGSIAEPYALPLNVEGKHPLKMTATFCMDADFARGAAEGDLVAAFVGDECRGVATSLVTADGTRVYCIEINGSVSGDERVKMKYYSARKSYLYETEGTFRFAADMVYGTEEAPKQLVLVHVM